MSTFSNKLEIKYHSFHQIKIYLRYPCFPRRVKRRSPVSLSGPPIRSVYHLSLENDRHSTVLSCSSKDRFIAHVSPQSTMARRCTRISIQGGLHGVLRTTNFVTHSDNDPVRNGQYRFRYLVMGHGNKVVEGQLQRNPHDHHGLTTGLRSSTNAIMFRSSD